MRGEIKRKKAKPCLEVRPRDQLLAQVAALGQRHGAQQVRVALQRDAVARLRPVHDAVQQLVAVVACAGACAVVAGAGAVAACAGATTAATTIIGFDCGPFMK